MGGFLSAASWSGSGYRTCYGGCVVVPAYFVYDAELSARSYPGGNK
ncbi:unnamed protein product [Ectocarpus sp. CCAP 1310/34]|nr:unnamed protein product [Ectocarpus sp. CCAP 1310/34]